MREANIERNTSETKISLKLNIDGTGKSRINSGCGFFDHMLTALSKHGRFDIDLTCDGDVEVDYHHSVEDIGIALGKAFSDALGDKSGINRYGYACIPLDEALILTSIDISGRTFLNFDADIPAQKVGDFDTELAEEFFYGFARSSAFTIHIKQLEGKNSHHIIEAMFKSFARALRTAVAMDPDANGEIPSTKGVL